MQLRIRGLVLSRKCYIFSVPYHADKKYPCMFLRVPSPPGVSLSLSTAQPTTRATPPQLGPKTVSLRAKEALSRPSVRGVATTPRRVIMLCCSILPGIAVLYCVVLCHAFELMCVVC